MQEMDIRLLILVYFNEGMYTVSVVLQFHNLNFASIKNQINRIKY